jgi:mannosyltransferase OCH1-like enzyme
MVAKLASPWASPTLGATAAQLRNRLPAQMRRCLPLYVAGVVLFLITANLTLSRHQYEIFERPPPPPKVPMAVRSDFPRKIWQTWKVDPLGFEQRDLDRARSWTGKNPGYRYEVLTDGNEMPYVEYHFGPEGFDRPDIVNFYREVQAAIVKADLLRYIVMYAEGGVYADIDVEDLKPVQRFIPVRYNERDIDMVIGVEIDEPYWRDHPILGPKSRSFCQWVFMSKPRNPVMLRLIEQIMSWLKKVARKQGVPLGDVKLDFDEIISGTGPSAFTEAILKEMNVQNPGSHKITWDDFHDMDESRIVGRTLVLTVEAFAAGQGHSQSGTHDARAALVKHHYHASNWPSRHPRYKHPAYGEVENCNWNADCVHKWDENVAAFEKMSEEEKKKVIADKEAKEAEEKRKKEEEEEKRRQEEEERKRKEEEDRIQKEKAEKAAQEEKDKKEKAAQEDKDKKQGPKEKPKKNEKPKP